MVHIAGISQRTQGYKNS